MHVKLRHWHRKAKHRTPDAFQPSMGESDREDKEPFGSALLTVSP